MCVYLVCALCWRSQQQAHESVQHWSSMGVTQFRRFLLQYYLFYDRIFGKSVKSVSNDSPVSKSYFHSSLFSTDKTYVESIVSFHRDHVQKFTKFSTSYSEETYPYLIKLNEESCQSLCHHLLMEKVGYRRYEILSSEFAIVSVNWKELENLSSLQHTTQPLIQAFITFHPDWKLDNKIQALVGNADNCRKRSNKSLTSSRYLYDSQLDNVVGSSSRKIVTKISQSIPAQIVLRFSLHVPSSSVGMDSFLQFINELEVLYGVHATNHSSESHQLRGSIDTLKNDIKPIREIILNLDERSGYIGGRRYGEHIQPKMETRMAAAPNRLREKISGDVYINDCRLVYEIAKKLAQRPEVVAVSLRKEKVLNNLFAKQTCDDGLIVSPKIALDKRNSSWINQRLTGAGTVVGIIDSGIALSNCYFYDTNNTVAFQQDLEFPVLNPSHRKIYQYVAFADTKENDSGHGSHVAGTIAGSIPEDSDNLGYPNYFSGDRFLSHQGMSVDAKIAFFDISGVEEHGVTLPVDINVDMFRVLYNNGRGAKIFANSWGSVCDSIDGVADDYDMDSENTDRFMYDNSNTLVIFAAGNEGGDPTVASGIKDAMGYQSICGPANAKNALTVGSTLSDIESWKFRYPLQSMNAEYFDAHTVAYFSSIGPTRDGRLKPDLLAPGWWISSAAGVPDATQPYCGLFGAAGTSSSAAVVAGMALKVQQYFSDGFYPSGFPKVSDRFEATGALLKAILIHASRPMKYLDTRKRKVTLLEKYPSIVQGYGRLELASTLKFQSPVGGFNHELFVVGKYMTSPSSAVALSQDTLQHTYYLHVNSISTESPTSNFLRITLCYTDYPASPMSTEVMVNLLDLRVRVNDSLEDSVIKPHIGEGVTTVSNVQVIDIADPPPNIVYAITVSVRHLATYSQPYALVVTGRFTMHNDFPIESSDIPSIDDSIDHEQIDDSTDDENIGQGDTIVIHHEDDFSYYYGDDDHHKVNDDDTSKIDLTINAKKKTEGISAKIIIAGASVSGTLLFVLVVFFLRRIRHENKFDEKQKELVKRISKQKDFFPGLTCPDGSLTSMQMTDDESDSYNSNSLEGRCYDWLSEDNEDEEAVSDSETNNNPEVVSLSDGNTYIDSNVDALQRSCRSVPIQTCDVTLVNRQEVLSLYQTSSSVNDHFSQSLSHSLT